MRKGKTSNPKNSRDSSEIALGLGLILTEIRTLAEKVRAIDSVFAKIAFSVVCALNES